MKLSQNITNLWGENNMRRFAIIHQSRVLEWPNKNRKEKEIRWIKKDHFKLTVKQRFIVKRPRGKF